MRVRDAIYESAGLAILLVLLGALVVFVLECLLVVLGVKW